MLVVLTRISIDAAKERPSHTPGDAMINSDFIAGHDLATSVRRHGVLLRRLLNRPWTTVFRKSLLIKCTDHPSKTQYMRSWRKMSVQIVEERPCSGASANGRIQWVPAAGWWCRRVGVCRLGGVPPGGCLPLGWVSAARVGVCCLGGCLPLGWVSPARVWCRRVGVCRLGGCRRVGVCRLGGCLPLGWVSAAWVGVCCLGGCRRVGVCRRWACSASGSRHLLDTPRSVG